MKVWKYYYNLLSYLKVWITLYFYDDVDILNSFKIDKNISREFSYYFLPSILIETLRSWKN